MEVKCLIEVRTRLGESALWSPEESCLYWLDLRDPAIFRFDPSTGTNEVWPLALDVPLGGIVRGKRDLLLASPGGVLHCDFKARRLMPWAQPNDRPGDTCFNDAKVDRDGRLWLSSSHVNEAEPAGGLYRVAADGTSVCVDRGFACGNGPAFDPDGGTLYFGDTIGRRVLAYDLDRRSGNVSNRRVFATFAEEDGQPDGMTVDAEGGIWVCHWMGARVTRFLPNGAIDVAIDMPVPNVTSCSFGGADLRTLYITTASIDMAADDLVRAPLAGSLFCVDVDVVGLPEPLFADEAVF